jgi:TolA-binding protein
MDKHNENQFEGAFENILAGKYKEAISYFEKLLNRSDKHVSALYHLGRAHIKDYSSSSSSE